MFALTPFCPADTIITESLKFFRSLVELHSITDPFVVLNHNFGTL